MHVRSPFFSVREWAGVVFSGDELAADGYARVRRGEGRIPYSWDWGWAPCAGSERRWSFVRGELVGGGRVFSPYSAGGELVV